MLDYCGENAANVQTSMHSAYAPPAPNSSVANLLQGMTERRDAFVLNNPPLAALHNMTEMKTPNSCASLCSHPLKTSPPSFSLASTPHGIQDILNLSRTSQTLLPHLNSSLQQPRPPIYPPTSTRFSKDLPKSPLSCYWPTQNSATISNLQSSAGSSSQAAIWRTQSEYVETPPQLLDKDGKKKHTRPTFSGHQIFALEKTFEQTKYLAGPERARLAYALGMSESQVKVKIISCFSTLFLFPL
ncbi:DgyrCDS5399 [Dimorphilus gyrociliatus]|uniref:DgyrCDS5399 n=1 Tax=Dimorphilus gyrociliatus TaxID=2664684 RepID=A0A7I8VPL4_9ANNE|nr:DgyrCDS5399 [Dimorphilus gyrociliatus]